MNINRLTAIGAETKKIGVDRELVAQIWYYVGSEEDTIEIMTANNFFKEATDRLKVDDLIYIYSPPEDELKVVRVEKNDGYGFKLKDVSNGEVGLELGETSTTAYRGDRGKIAYDHSQTTGNPHGTTTENIGAVGITGEQAIDGGLTLSGELSAANVSGFNTGDQDLSGLLPKSGGTMTGALVAATPSVYTTPQVFNLAFLDSEPSVGDMVEGVLYFVAVNA